LSSEEKKEKRKPAAKRLEEAIVKEATPKPKPKEEVKPTVPTKAEAPTTEERKIIECPKCGTINVATADQCVHCLTPLKPTEKIPTIPAVKLELASAILSFKGRTTENLWNTITATWKKGQHEDAAITLLHNMDAELSQALQDASKEDVQKALGTIIT